MKKLFTSQGGLSAIAAAVLVGLGCGCTTQQQTAPMAQPAVVEPVPAPTPAPAPRSMAPAGFKVAAAAFPTGERSTSALWVEKIVPERVLVGQPFDIVYKVTNLTPLSLRDVTVTDTTAENFRVESSTPKPTGTAAGETTWVLGEMAPKSTSEIRIRGVALAEGFVTGCGRATFQPYVCETVEVVAPAISLAKTMPAQVVACDPIPVRIVVKNEGTSRLTNVRVTDALPAGLATETGQNSVAFDAGTLAPGESKEFAFNAKASRTGKFVNPAKVTSAEGVEASAEASVAVVSPVLSVECQVPQQKKMGNLTFTEFVGRGFDVCWTVKNSGDAPSANTVVQVPLPAGVSLRSATAGGTATGATAVWNLGTLAPGASKQVCGTFVSSVGGSYKFDATTSGGCAAAAKTSCSVFVQGVNAILVEVVDDPDPIQVGEQTTYTIRVTNQGGGLDLVSLAIKANFPAEIDPTTASNGGQVSGKSVVWPVIAALPMKQSISYTVVGKAVAGGDARVQVEVTTQERQNAIVELESTTTY